MLERNARLRLTRLATLNIARTARLRYRSLAMKPNNSLTIGEGSILEGAIAFEREGAAVVIGRDTFVGSSQIVCASRIEIGDDVLVSWGCTILDHNSHSTVWRDRAKDVKEWYRGRKDWSNVVSLPVKLGNKCWVGMHSIILKGVEVGEGAIVAAGSIVTKDIPPWTIAGGNPARVIREIPADERQ